MKVLTDIHTHTIASTHAYSTIIENAKAARVRGLEAIAMTDHCGELPDSAHIWHFVNLKIIPEYIEGVRILRGAEVNIIDTNGSVDMPEDVMKKLDIVIASIHRPCYGGADEKDHTSTYMGVVENPYVDIIGHSGNPDFAYDYEKVICRARDMGKMIEINAGTFNVRKSNIPNCKKIAQICKEVGAHICVSSDSHFADYIGAFDNVYKILDEIGFPEELIANRTLDDLKRFLAPRKIID